MPSTSSGRRAGDNAKVGGAALSGLGFGLVSLIAGIALHAHYGPIDGLCSSGVGVLAQQFDQSVQAQCGLAMFLDAIGQAGIGMGIFALIGGGLAGLIFVVSSGLMPPSPGPVGAVAPRPTVTRPTRVTPAVNRTVPGPALEAPAVVRPRVPASADPPNLRTPAAQLPSVDRDSSRTDRVRERLWGDQGDR